MNVAEFCRRFGKLPHIYSTLIYKIYSILWFDPAFPSKQIIKINKIKSIILINIVHNTHQHSLLLYNKWPSITENGDAGGGSSAVELHTYIHREQQWAAPTVLHLPQSQPLHPTCLWKVSTEEGPHFPFIPPSLDPNSHSTIIPNTASQCQEIQSKEGFRELETSQIPSLSSEGFPTQQTVYM